MQLAIRNGRVLDPASKFDARADVFVDDGRIASIGAAPHGFVADQTLDASGLVVAPGLVDLCARMREPGTDGALKVESHAALAGGITGLVCPPDTDPPLDEPGLVRMLRQRSREAAGARLYPLGALTAGLAGEVLAEIETLAEVGCVAFAQTATLPPDNGVLLQAMRYARTFDLPIWLRPVEDTLAARGVAAAGAVAARLGLPSIPEVAETVALHTVFELQRVTGARVHLCRLSSRSGVELVRRAKHEGLPVTCDVGIHHVHLIDVDIGYFDSNFRLDPPLRSGRDRDAIRAGLADGTIDAICSDHTPVDADDKLLPFDEAAPGATALETLLPLVLKWASEERIGMLDALGKVSSTPGQILAEPTGRLAVGAKADIFVFDPQEPWRPLPASLVSHGKNTPFSSYELVGRTRYTLVGGDVRFSRK
ncbi:MAG TPA: dihydroorotase [Burkholderiaceae bacterium]|nr:dihydroorotase [Burkholderiaceae bacterium]